MSTRAKDSVKELTASFLSVLDNEDVVAKLANTLSASINLILIEKMNPVLQKLDKIISDNKALNERIVNIERENDKLKQVNAGMLTSIDSLQKKVNLLEQDSLKNNIIINGITETYAERVTDGMDDDDPPPLIREDTVETACSVFHDSCNVTVVSADIKSAFRLKSKRPGPRPLLVSFHSHATKMAVVRARRPKQTLSYHGVNIYINDHLTAINSDLSNKARQLVKQQAAFSTWVRDGQIYIKWSRNDRPARINCLADLND